MTNVGPSGAVSGETKHQQARPFTGETSDTYMFILHCIGKSANYDYKGDPFSNIFWKIASPGLI